MSAGTITGRYASRTSSLEEVDKEYQQFTPTSSPQQLGIFDFVKHGRGSAIAISVAGSGKTTTLVGKADERGRTLLPGAVDFMRGSIALVAYGARNGGDFDAKLNARGIGWKQVSRGTAHSFGWKAWRGANKDREILIDEKQKWNRILGELKVPEHLHSFVKSLVSLAKQRAVGTYVCADRPSTWDSIVEHFDLAYELADETTGSDVSALLPEGIQWARKCLDLSVAIGREIVDYDDMIYMVLKSNCRVWENDWLLVDEAQDTNPARRALYRKMLKRNGRAIFVGDPHQAIFGFTGADNDSLELIKNQFGCCELPLTVSFRCPQKVVELARTWVGHITAHESNSAGTVKHISYAELLAKKSELRAADAILCRNTKPLVSLAFTLIRHGVACHVEGKEIGLGLLALTKKWKLVKLEALKDRLSNFLVAEVKKLFAKGKEEKVSSLEDRVGTVMVIADSLEPGSTVRDLQDRIMTMFADTPDGQRADTLTLCTVHKSKGMEWKRVYLLGRNKYMGGTTCRQEWQTIQERNLCYVAVTRSMDTLIEVDAE